MSSQHTGRLFEPIQVGDITLSHRIVLAPLTRMRNDIHHVPIDESSEYYSQRASTPGTLLISEGTLIAARAAGIDHVPGIWSEAQTEGWKKMVKAVHSKKSFLYLQICALGLSSIPAVLERDGFDYVSASDVPLSFQPTSVPRPLTIAEIDDYVQDFSAAATRFVFTAGGDGVEIHACNGSLLDQFLQTSKNKRTDDYGGSAENRARFVLRVVDAVAEAVGEQKVGLRLSPFSTFKDMRMSDHDLLETYSYLAREVKRRHPNFAYLHVVEPRVNGPTDAENLQERASESTDFLKDIWSPRPFIVAGGFLPDTAAEETSKHDNVLVAFGRRFISNPDLVSRIEKGQVLAPYDRSTFYTGGLKGYIDYPFHG